jgi:hypothetical protein
MIQQDLRLRYPTLSSEDTFHGLIWSDRYIKKDTLKAFLREKWPGEMMEIEVRSGVVCDTGFAAQIIFNMDLGG